VKRLAVALLISLALVATPLTAAAQPIGRVPRIGILRTGSPPDPFVEAFLQGLRELGYDDGGNISIEYRWAEGRDEQLPDLAADLVRLKVDVIVAGGSQARVAKRATTTIPIVMPVANDPVGEGIVASLARPGGNVTGLAFLSEGLPGKWVELLKEVLPGMSRVAVLWHPATEAGQLRVSETAARSLGVRLRALKVRRPDEFSPAFAEAQRNHAECLIVLSSPFFYAHRTRLVELAAKHRLPRMYHQQDFVVGSGGLMSYGPNLRDLFRRAATYVDKVLKGAKPADLPIEQPTRFELVINMKTAKALGLTIPQSVLARADEVIQ
jgi:putative ABC transport system substrate-binding protein